MSLLFPALSLVPSSMLEDSRYSTNMWFMDVMDEGVKGL